MYPSDQEVELMINKLDTNQDKKVNYFDLRKIFRIEKGASSPYTDKSPDSKYDLSPINIDVTEFNKE